LNLYKSTIFSGISTVIKVLTTFISGKLAAVLIGPAGIAIVGAFSNLINVVSSLSNGAIVSGVVKYTSEYSDDSQKLKKLLSSVTRIALFATIIISGILILFPRFVSTLVFKDEQYYDLVILLGITLVFISFNTVLLAVINGLQQIRFLTEINIITSVVGLIITVASIYFYNLWGALIALVLAQGVGFFITFFYILKFDLINWRYFLGKIAWQDIRKLGSYSFMAIVTAFTAPLSQIFLRNLLVSKFGISEAGYWQASIRISEGYLMILSTSLATYYLPKLSSLTETKDIRNEVIKGLRFIIPIVLSSAFFIFLFKTTIITVLFTESFRLVEEFMTFQLIGDVLKMTAWVFAYLMIAKSMVIQFVLSEIGFNLIYIGLTLILLDKIGITAISFSYAVSYFFYLVYLIYLFRGLFNQSILKS
jgi:O-antigen/teichoic acid export membrane protein